MNLDLSVVEQLRLMFLTGATPFRLVCFIAEHHAEDPKWPRYVQQYFWEAFFVTFLALENYPHDKKLRAEDFSSRNVAIIHDIIRQIPRWRDNDDPESAELSSWCDELEIPMEELEMVEQLAPESHPSLSASWPNLNSPVQDFIRQTMTNSRIHYEQVQFLKSLITTLQKQIIELEKGEVHGRAES